ncbi:hypothetical protein FP359_24395 [Klebsiella variicola]|uniref:hypothetical protein n=1 Tax=Klebsiella variicola TaxID=244366 RepID=UPI001C978961|nr:hypothetical protein [Klebsiella variicola]MBY5172990.1 hypothetical protein [Klebsiella variicola]
MTKFVPEQNEKRVFQLALPTGWRKSDLLVLLALPTGWHKKKPPGVVGTANSDGIKSDPPVLLALPTGWHKKKPPGVVGTANRMA